MKRAISGYHRDDKREWVAELSCGHGQHVRHRPPFQLREWVLDAEGRSSKIGKPLDCPLCDRAEMPEGLRLVRSSQEWDESSIPVGLTRAHRIAEGTWGRISVRRGRLRFVAHTRPELEIVLGPDSTQAIPPGIEHEVQPLGPVRFSIDFLSIHASDQEVLKTDDANDGKHGNLLRRDVKDEGSDPACWTHLLCPKCGTVLDREGAAHSCCSDISP